MTILATSLSCLAISRCTLLSAENTPTVSSRRKVGQQKAEEFRIFWLTCVFLWFLGTLRRISRLKPWGLFEVLTEKYEWPAKEAQDFAEFLLPMLAFDPKDRATAATCLRHPWLGHNSDSSPPSPTIPDEVAGACGTNGVSADASPMSSSSGYVSCPKDSKYPPGEANNRNDC